MNLESLIWISIVLHVFTSVFLLAVTVYTYWKMSRTTVFVQETIIKGVENGTKQLKDALENKKTYNLLVEAIETRLVTRLDELVKIQNKQWASRMSQMSKFAPDIVAMGAAVDDGPGIDPISCTIEAMTHKRGPVGWLNENAPRVAKGARQLYAKWSVAKPAKPPAPKD